MVAEFDIDESYEQVGGRHKRTKEVHRLVH